MKKHIITESVDETENFATSFASEVKPGSVIALKGELGSGKTVFARGFARGLGIKETVASPTYTLIHEYKLGGNKSFYHLDLYRINDSTAALAFGIDEYLEDESAIILIEWAERISDMLENKIITVSIKHLGENSREITIS